MRIIAEGNTKFTSVAEIISTVNAHDNIVNKVQSNAPPDLAPARVTFTRAAGVSRNGRPRSMKR